MIELKNISYKIKDKMILENINLTINKGDNIAIVGPNGAGKTTLMNLILNIPVFNYNYKTHKLKGIINNTMFDINNYHNVKTCLQNSNFSYNLYLKVKELINLCFDNQIPINLVKEFGLEDKMNSLVRNLSGGEYQKLNILLTVGTNPDIIFLDEITTGLDYESKRKILECIRSYTLAKDKTLICVTHYLEELPQIADKVIFMDKGKILENGNLVDLYRKYKLHSICDLYEEVVIRGKNL